MTQRIEDYALIGDCLSAALVGRNGSIDWLCWPRFDSDACFAALLGDRENGHWRIAPCDAEAKVTRAYRHNTLILETRFATASGAVRLVDFMPMNGRKADLVRLVVGEQGEVEMAFELVLRFGTGAIVPWVTRLDDRTWRAIAGPDMVALHAPVDLRGAGFKTVGRFAVQAGQTVPFVLTYGPSHRPAPPPIDAASALAQTERYWRDWASRCRPPDHCSEAVIRSLITLKALTYAPTGGIVAAPTTSLPEHLGGSRNWDYRYCWLRDATLTLLALMNAGFFDEAHDWREWLVRAVAGSPDQLQIMYGIAGERLLREWEVPWLSGYEQSRPVRIGNAAYGQLQLDVYGEVMDALHQARCGGLAASESGWAIERAMLDRLTEIWREPDESIWEVRGPRRHFTYSKVMAWVAFDRAIKSAESFGLDGDIAAWRRTAAEIRADVLAHGYDADRNTFVQSYGRRELDASLLLLPVVGFLPASDPRIGGTLRAVERELMVDGLLRRYDTEQTPDGLPAGEGVFFACSFWLVDAYMLEGRHGDARKLLDRLLDLRNDVGLLSEEYDPVNKRHLGNFPQAFSHIALINSVFNLSHGRKPAAQRGGTPPADAPQRAEAAVAVSGG